MLANPDKFQAIVVENKTQYNLNLDIVM